MGNDSVKVQMNAAPSAETQIKERKTIRWMMVFYDTLVFLVCWLAVFVLHPSAKTPFPQDTVLLYLVSGYVLFFGFRFALKSYKQIWRYGYMQAFTREIISGVLASVLLVLLGEFVGRRYEIAEVPVTSIVAFAGVYVLISVVMRLLYSNVYYYIQRDTKVSRTVKNVFETLTFVDLSSKVPGATMHLVLEPEKPALPPINELQRIAEQFAIRGDITAITQINKGYINRTYRVETLSETGHVHKYTLQRINTNVFPDVDALMDNFKLTTDHLYGRFLLPGHRKKGSVQTIRPTKDGRSFLRDDSGCWRMLTHFDNVYSLDIPNNPEVFYHAGDAFGRFIKEMSDVDVADVKEVIPNFHNTMSRYMDLEEAITRNPKNRVKDVGPEIAFVRARADRYGLISEALISGKIPTRICHNDCNLNNILFDNETHLPVAIIDLDTVMPSSPLYDYGDSMRIGTNTAKDDEKDLSKVSCDLNLYEQYAWGYLKACGDVLTKEELELMPFASLIITSEDGIRFLMDHINGDTYYHIYYPGQNLDRARTQLKLVEDMEKKLPEIKKILRKIYAELGLKAEIL